jgi:hypothetical protein
MGAAIIAALSSLEISSSLPNGGTAGQILKKITNSDGDADWGALSVSDILGLTSELAGKAPTSDIVTLTNALAAKADASALATLSSTVSGKASTASVTALSATVDTKASTAALDAKTFRSLVGVDGVTDPLDGWVYAYDSGSSKIAPTNIATQFAQADESTGQTVYEAAAPNTLFGFIVPVGENPPPGLPVGLGVPIIGFERPLPIIQSISLLTSDSARAVTNVVLTMPQALDAGAKVLLAIGWGADNANVVNNINITQSSGTTEKTFTTLLEPNGTIGIVICELEVLTDMANAATITITARNASNVALTKTHIMAAAFSVANQADDALNVVKSSGSLNSSSNMATITTGATATDTTEENELAFAVAGWNSSSSPTTRVLGGTNGWQKLVEVKSDNGSTARSIAVFWQLQQTIGRPNLTTQMVASDNATGQAAAQLATFKGV